jgi:hypothetical protein
VPPAAGRTIAIAITLRRTHMRRARCAAVIAGLVAIAFAQGGGNPLTAKRDYQAAMRQFVQAISVTAKKSNPAFLVVPQGGIDLLTANGKPDGKPDPAYLKAIDVVGQEEIFYGFDNKDNRKTPKKETDHFLKQLAVARAAGKVAVNSVRRTRRREHLGLTLRTNANALGVWC